MLRFHFTKNWKVPEILGVCKRSQFLKTKWERGEGRKLPRNDGVTCDMIP